MSRFRRFLPTCRWRARGAGFVLALAVLASAGEAVAQERPRVWGINPVGLLPGNGDAHELGESLDVEVLFSEPVIVGGAPHLVLAVGRETRLASLLPPYLRQPSSTLIFRYVVGPSDRDTDGFSVPANPLRPHGGAIKAAADGETDADLTHGGFASRPFHKVDGTRVTVPAVRRLSFLRRSDDDGTVQRGSTIRLEVEFTRPVAVSGRPQLAFEIGGATRLASYHPDNLFPRSLFFRYVVRDGDRDTDGARIPADALRLNGGSIEAAVDGSVDASLSHGAVVASPPLKVDGGTFVAVPTPRVRLVTFGHHDPVVLERGEELNVSVYFTTWVFVAGNPKLVLSVGGQTRFATCSGGASLRCRYTVQAEDRDTDGVSIPANAIRLDGASITSAEDGATDAVLTHAAVESDGIPMVDGSLSAVPRARGVFFADPVDYREDGDTYVLGQSIRILVRFDRPVRVTGTPVMALTVGGRRRLAACSGDYNEVTCRYRVQAADRDTDGVSVPGNALRLNNGTIAKLSDGGATPAALDHGPLAADPRRKVDGSRGPTATTEVRYIHWLGAANGHTFEFGEIISVRVGFEKPVIARGRPQLALKVGRRTRMATCHGSGTELVCLYTVQASDRDADGISIAANAFRLSGGTIKAAPDGVRDAVLTHPPVVDDSSSRVDGGRATTLGASLQFVSPLDGATYERGETIWVVLRVGRDSRLGRGGREVVVTGSPQVALRIGDRERLATYSAKEGQRRLPASLQTNRGSSVWFGYTVQASDRDTDGVSVGEKAVRLNGGAIRLAVDGATEPELTNAPVGTSYSGQVDGSRFTRPIVERIALEGLPENGTTYGVGESIRVVVRFTRAVTIAGAPEVTLTIGGQTRVASYSPGPSGGRTHIFEYVVRPGDRDTDGISIPANALGLNGGRITLMDGLTDVDLTHPELGDDIARKLDARDDGVPGVPVDDCEPDAETACLQDSRFEVRAIWWGSDGRSGPGQLANAETSDSGLFWFFDEENWEILVKVLDGCSINGHYWVFGAATTDLGYRITVTDTATGRVRVYRHEPGEPAAAITDSTAFADSCRR